MTQLHRDSGEHAKNTASRLLVRLSSFEMCTGALMLIDFVVPLVVANNGNGPEYRCRIEYGGSMR
jgi:hypothetical protein